MAKKVDIAALAKKLDEINNGNNNRSNQGTGLNYHSIKDGRNLFRILPPRDDMDSFAVEAWLHYGVGKTKEKPKGRTVICPKSRDENAKCPICELAFEYRGLSKDKNDRYGKLFDDTKRKKRVYFNAINREDDLAKYEKDAEGKWRNTESDEDREESPVKVLATGFGIYQDLLKIIVDPEYGDFTDPEEGLDIIITKSGSGRYNTEYDVKTVRKESPIGFDEWEECMELNDLNKLSEQKLSYDELAKLLTGAEATEDDDEEDDEPQEKSSTNSKGEEPKDDTNTDGDSEDDGDLDDEIAKALARRKKK